MLPKRTAPAPLHFRKHPRAMSPRGPSRRRRGDRYARQSPAVQKSPTTARVTRVVAQVGDDQSIPVVTGINLRQRTGALTAIKALRQLVEFLNAQDSRRIARITADHRG